MIFTSQLPICGVNFFPHEMGMWVVHWNIIVWSSTLVSAVILDFMAYQFVVFFFPLLVRAFPQMLMQGVSEKAFSLRYLQQPCNSSCAHFCHLKWFHTHLCLSSLYLNSWEVRSKLTWRSSGKRLLIQFSLSTSHGRMMFSLIVILCVYGFI